MSHRAQRDFVASVKRRYPHFFSGATVLDVGSLDVNGSTRPFFSGGSYLGIDLVAGKGVDKVCTIEAIHGQFDVVISTECLEHDPQWRATFAAMIEHAHIGGLVLMTCAGPGRPEHGTLKFPVAGMSNDTNYYRTIAPNEIIDLAMRYGWEQIGCFYEPASHDTYFFGIRA